MALQDVLLENLLAKGLTRTQAQRWIVFVTEATQLLDAAGIALNDGDQWLRFLGRLGQRTVEEPDITTELYYHMEKVKERSPLGSPLRELEVKCEDPVHAENRAGRFSKAADLVVATFRSEKALRFVVEAKLLRAQADVAGSYLGPEGMGCFTNVDSPYSLHEVAGMVGYARTQTLEFWTDLLKAGLDGSVPHTLQSAGDVEIEPGGGQYLFGDLLRSNLGLVPLFMLHRILLLPEEQPA